MIVIDYQKKSHNDIIHACAGALKSGKVVAYPTDTSYGLAADVSQANAVKKLYQIKGRKFNKAVSIVVPSIKYGQKIVSWDKRVLKLCKKFWPGALTLVLPAKSGAAKFAHGTKSADNFLALRMPKNKIALDLAKFLKKPITATSANVSGQADCYSATEILKQYKKIKNKPDIIINAGVLPKQKPSTIVKIFGNEVKILRQGPISEKALLQAL